jgi:hypothetical protein
MLKIIKQEEQSVDKIIPMSQMQPLQVGVIVVDDPTYEGHYVMRTQSAHRFEVMNLSKPSPDFCWTNDGCTLKVRLLRKDEKVTLELWND